MNTYQGRYNKYYINYTVKIYNYLSCYITDIDANFWIIKRKEMWLTVIKIMLQAVLGIK